MPYENLLQGLTDVLNGQRIQDATSIDLSKTLIKVFLLIGLRQNHYPTKEEHIFIEAYIRKNYYHKTLDELYLAFDLAIKNQLECDAKVYDQFTIEYLVRVMDAYKKWLRNNYTPPKKEIQETIMEISKEEKIADINEWEQKDKINLYLLPVYLYDWLLELNYINPTREEKIEIFAKAKELHKDKLKTEAIESGNFRQFNKFLEYDESEKQMVQNLAKRMIVYNYLKSKK